MARGSPPRGRGCQAGGMAGVAARGREIRDSAGHSPALPACEGKDALRETAARVAFSGSRIQSRPRRPESRFLRGHPRPRPYSQQAAQSSGDVDGVASTSREKNIQTNRQKTKQHQREGNKNQSSALNPCRFNCQQQAAEIAADLRPGTPQSGRSWSALPGGRLWRPRPYPAAAVTDRDRPSPDQDRTAAASSRAALAGATAYKSRRAPRRRGRSRRAPSPAVAPRPLSAAQAQGRRRPGQVSLM